MPRVSRAGTGEVTAGMRAAARGSTGAEAQQARMSAWRAAARDYTGTESMQLGDAPLGSRLQARMSAPSIQDRAPRGSNASLRSSVSKVQTMLRASAAISGGGGGGIGGGGGDDSTDGQLTKDRGSFGGGGPGRPVMQSRMSMPTMRPNLSPGQGPGGEDDGSGQGRPVLQRRPSMTSVIGVDGMARAAAAALTQPMGPRRSASPTGPPKPPLGPTSSTSLIPPTGSGAAAAGGWAGEAVSTGGNARHSIGGMGPGQAGPSTGGGSGRSGSSISSMGGGPQRASVGDMSPGQAGPATADQPGAPPIGSMRAAGARASMGKLGSFRSP